MLKRIKVCLIRRKVENKLIIKSMLHETPFEKMSREELRDYYTALGKYDCASEMLYIISQLEKNVLFKSQKAGD